MWNRIRRAGLAEIPVAARAQARRTRARASEAEPAVLVSALDVEVSSKF